MDSKGRMEAGWVRRVINLDLAIVEIAEGRIDRPFEENEVFSASETNLLNRILSLKKAGMFPDAFKQVGL